MVGFRKENLGILFRKMLRWIFVVSVVGLVSGVKIPLSQIKAPIYQEPHIYGPIRTTAVELEYVEQRVDNFDAANDATWQMVKKKK